MAHVPGAWSRALLLSGLVVASACAGACRRSSSGRSDTSAGPTAPVAQGQEPAAASEAPAAARPGASPKGVLPKDTSVVFLHHSTGENVWNGGVAEAIEQHNQQSGTRYRIAELAFPHDPYAWENYPYDYWTLWVEHGGERPHMGQETLEMLTRKHQVVVFKHCFPVSAIGASTGPANAASSDKTLPNYQAQYAALKTKLRSFPGHRFLVWTAAALTRTAMTNDYEGNDEMARRAQEFAAWVRERWDEPGDNIFVFDFHALETEGSLYMRDGYAEGPGDPHPNEAFSRKVAPLLGRRIVDVIEGRADHTDPTGKG